MTNAVTADDTNVNITTLAKAEVIVSTNNFLLTNSDRCETCNAEAVYQVTMSNNYTLTFCKHHFKVYESKLLVDAVSILDESAKLFNK